MSFAKKLFLVIDKIYARPQNPPKMEREFSDVQCESDLHYSAKYPEMTLDLFRMSAEKRPVILEIHGGGFAAGDKKFRRCLCRYYAKNTGAAVANVNYGVGAENACPVPHLQLVEAVNFLAENAERFNLDLSRFVVTGDSAGGYFACFLAALQDSRPLQQLFGCKLNARFTAAVLNCGVFDLTANMSKKTLFNRGICKEFCNVEMEEIPSFPYFDALNLTQFVTEKFPPALLIHSQKDVFCKGQAEKLIEQLRLRGVPCRDVFSTKFSDNHTYSLTWKSRAAKLANVEILRFLNGHFHGEQ